MWFTKSMQIGDTIASSNTRRGIVNPVVRRYVFISYRRDGGFFAAECMRLYLKYKGVKLFMDLHNIACGDKWKDEITEVIKKSKCFILVVTPDIFATEKKDDCCEFELRTALDNSIKIIQFIVNTDGANVPDNVGDYKGRDLFMEKAFKYLNNETKSKLLQYQNRCFGREYADDAFEKVYRAL